MKKIKVVELFAGVGGFRIGLDEASGKTIKYETVWNNQWEPGAKIQYASQIYIKRFGAKNHSCEDIQEIIKNKFKKIPNHDLLVGGFPCQDYSVARTLNQSEGISGKKGILWWSIFNILKKKGKDSPQFLMLENVDRLLKSPSKQRGRDFAIMLASLSKLGYAVEWRVINAADYGFPQRRRRVFILGYKKGSKVYNLLIKEDVKNWIHNKGVITKAFPLEESDIDLKEFKIEGNLEEISEEFSSDSPSKTPFENSGVMINKKIYTTKINTKYDGESTLLGDIIIKNEKKIPKEFFVEKESLEKWKKLKGKKKEKRRTQEGFEYSYSEGAMIFPDSLDRPSRTIVTGEGGTSPSRFKHVIKTKSGKLRRLTPIELEKLNMFPEDHTKLTYDDNIVPDTKRSFIMGNALVVGVIRGLGESLSKFI